MRFQRTIQLISLGIFLFLLLGAGSELLVSTDLFLRLDPLLVWITAIGARTLTLPILIPAAVVVGSCILAGRIFCGYFCPMGTTLDGADALIPAIKPAALRNGDTLHRVKFGVLAFLLGAACCGVSYVFAGAPLSLITRFYGLLAYPAIKQMGHALLPAIRSLAEVHLPFLAYAQIPLSRFATQFFILFFFLALFAHARLSPRFWCRYLCPSGALMALFSHKPIIRRRVAPDCTQCGKCVRKCPMNAIPTLDPGTNQPGSCIVCRKCESVCPVSAVSFTATGHNPTPKATLNSLRMARRDFIHFGFAGAATALVNLVDLSAPYGETGEGRVISETLIRPPGARPETDFLSRCVRCGQCMAACPTNTLQPLWLTAGFMGIFSPAITPRRGFCDPNCNRCGSVCPTGAIRALPKPERVWAKTGTAIIFRQKCLAWEHQKACVVCDEVCPFDAISLIREAGNPVALPHVIADKCAGCGYCEHYCPVQNQAAIVVSPMGALRLPDGAYIKEGRSRGLTLQLKSKTASSGDLPSAGMMVPGDGPPPGFDPVPP